MVEAVRARPALISRLGLIPLWPVLLFVTVILAVAMLSPLADWERMKVWLAGLSVYVFFRFYRSWPAPRSVLKWAGTALAIITLLESAAVLGRPRWENPNMLASAMLLTLPHAGRGLVFPLAALVTTQSRGAWVGGLAALAAVRWQGLSRKWLWALAAVGLVVLMVAIRPATVTVRLLVWTEAAQLWRARPVHGWGLGAYPALAVIEPQKAHADSLPLTLMAETGVMGLAAFVVLAAVVAAKARRVGGPAAWALLAWGVHQLVDCTLFEWPILLVAMNLALLEGES